VDYSQQFGIGLNELFDGHFERLVGSKSLHDERSNHNTRFVDGVIPDRRQLVGLSQIDQLVNQLKGPLEIVRCIGL
jgi:hypothetical protein